jgi:ribose 5-phosphate isomerase A
VTGPENTDLGPVDPASPWLPWPEHVIHLERKRDVARRIAARARDDDVIGIGSGSAAFLTLQEIGRRARAEHLRVRVVPTSYETEVAAGALGLALLRLGQARPHWGVDGADEIDPDRRLLKGRGGALFREKLLWNTTAQMLLAIDESKHVTRLGTHFPVPIEVHPNAVELVGERLRALGCTAAALRTSDGKDGPVITESGFVLLDAHFATIAPGLSSELKAIPGVLETGLFEGYAFDPFE